MASVLWVENKLEVPDFRPVSADDARGALSFWRGAPFYAPSPLVRLDGAARRLGLGAVYLKDEGRRFGTGSFKFLGAGYAMARALGAESWSAAANAARRTTFYTATDGNHGRAVARAARLLGQSAVVLMPAGSTRARFDAIAAEGARVTIEDANYDECVRRAASLAAESGGVLLQDTTQPGYELLPREIMRGYGTIAAELASELASPPTHVVLQAGVGSFAGALASALAELYTGADITFLVAEAAAAPCLLRSVEAGAVRTVDGDIRTIMAGLACGEPCSLGLASLEARAKVFAAIDDDCAAAAMRDLASGADGDERVTAGESGAAGYALLRAAMLTPELAGLRAAASLDERSRVLVINTETATDPDSYRRIVGNFAGQNPS